MSLNNLKTNLKSLPTHANDFNFICTPTYAEYKVIIKILSTLMLPLTFIHEALQGAINLINKNTYAFLKKNLDDLNGTIKDILKTPIKDLKHISADLADFGNALSKGCEFFMSTLPDDMFNLFQDLQYGLKDITNGLVRLPNSITNSIMKTAMDFKLEAMQDILGTLYSTILIPLLAYESFLKENGIVDLINKAYQLEVCMMKPGICHKDPSFFTHSLTKRPKSQYYKNQFFINNRGEINFNLLTLNKSHAKQCEVVYTNLKSYLSY